MSLYKHVSEKLRLGVGMTKVGFCGRGTSMAAGGVGRRHRLCFWHLLIDLQRKVETGFPLSRIAVNLARAGNKKDHEEPEGVTKATKKSVADAKEIKKTLRPEPCRSYESHPLVAHEEIQGHEDIGN
jgi:hypothetical protein